MTFPHFRFFCNVLRYQVTFFSFSFRAWMGLIWEISAHAAHQNAWNFGEHLFCKNTKKSGFNDIYNIQLFQVIKLVRVPVFLSSKLSQTGSCSSISQFKTESKWFVFQYFSVQNWLEWFVFQYFPNSKYFRRDFHIKYCYF